MRGRPYDAIIVDQTMPGLSGLEVIRAIAAGGSAPPTIVVTGTGNEQIAVEAMKLGVSDYLIKDLEGGFVNVLPLVGTGPSGSGRCCWKNSGWNRSWPRPKR